MPGKHMAEGEEVVVVPAEPVHKPFTVRYRFEPTAGGGFGLGDVAVAGTSSQTSTGDAPVEHDVPAEAIDAAGGLDPIGTAQEYIRARLGFIPDDMHLNEGFSGEENATVDWQDGSVFLMKRDGYWYVTESIGSSVSFTSITAGGTYIDVQTFLGEAGELVLQVLDADGRVCAESTTDVEGRGGSGYTFEDITCDASSIVATMGAVVAERAATTWEQ
jgi:hypothetical protein